MDLRIGDWPFCGGDPTKHEPALHFGDDPITPYVDENIDTYPVEIRTRGERRRLMTKNNLDYIDLSAKKRGKVYVDLHRR